MSETMNFLGGSPLNRLSWLRPSAKFLNMAIDSLGTRWTVFQAGKPLVKYAASGGPKSLALLKTGQIRHLLGGEPYFGQSETVGEVVSSSMGSTVEACRLRGPRIVFLGLEEPDGTQALPSSEFRTPETATDISGFPYFSVDMAVASDNAIEELISTVAEEGQTMQFDEPHNAAATFTPFEAAIFAEARSMLDWNTRNKFCPACGSQTYSLWGGWKLSCVSLLPWAKNEGREMCPSGTGLQNYVYPRTDPVVITLVLDETGDRILLGRNQKWPGKLYSALAGFCEPAESFEDAAKREIWEESGIRIHNVRYHSSQPWPYPANVMVGCYAFADSSQTIRTDLDNELSEARWFTRAEVSAALGHPQGTSDNQTKNKPDSLDDTPATPDQRPFRVPPRTAIAGVLISDWVSGKHAGGIIRGSL